MIILDNKPRALDLKEIFLLDVGGVFKYDYYKVDYETVLELIKAYIPLSTCSVFEVAYVPPGSNLYVDFGAGSVVVTKKVLRPIV